MSCTCGTSFNNTGLPGCIPVWTVFKKIIAVPLEANDGTSNYIDLTATLNSAYFSALINNVDSSKRWYPLPSLKNVESTKAENITESFSDGSIAFVQEGVRSFKALLVGQGVQYAAQLKAARCTTFGIYGVDGSGNLIGYTNNETGKLYPIPVDQNTWAPVWQIPTDTTLQKIELNFQFESTLLDDYLDQIVSSDMTGVNLLSLEGLIDIYSTIVSTSTTAMVIKLYTRFGSAINRVVDQGLLVGDFYSSIGGTASRIYNVTTSTMVTLSGVVESPNGTYTLSYTGPLSTNVLRVTPVKTGRDYTAVIANTAVVA